MSGIVGGLETLWEAVINLPLSIFNQFKDWLTDIYNAITGIPSAIINGIKDIFIPDMAEIDASIDAFVNEIHMKFGINLDVFSVIFSEELPVTDIVIPSYEISGVGNFVFTILDTEFFYQGITYFRPFIRGFIVLLILLYNVKMFLSFIRQDLGIATGKGADIHAEAEKERKGGSK